ncbi:hypothetical protein AVEN_197680-1 [Araneus ventricosus]|uniref:Gustatory receptor n=1 Tax=Araneus ventricosus TaxID=182803 RepID=A0A4Y2U2L7_ARAVE|nr:hypothetical protein AVEN_197680-1 [Araneus ventricosus]
MIGFSVDYVRRGGMRNVPVTKAVEHLYATTAKFSKRVCNLGLTSCVLLPATSDSDNISLGHVTFPMFGVLLIAMNFENLILPLILRQELSDLKWILPFFNSYFFGLLIWFALRRRRKVLSDLLVLLQEIQPFAYTINHTFLVAFICSIPVIQTTLTFITSISTQGPSIYTAMYGIQNPWIEAAVKCIKSFLLTFIFPTLPNLVTLLYCILCERICKSISSLTYEIQTMSPEEFSMTRQINVIRLKGKVQDALDIMQKGFSVPIFFISVAYFSSCCSILGMFVSVDIRLLDFPVIVSFALTLANAFIGLLACFWVAGGVPIETEKYKGAFCKKIRQRLLQRRNLNEISFQKLDNDQSIFVLSGCNVIHFRRSSVLAIIGTIITYTLLLLRDEDIE